MIKIQMSVSQASDRINWQIIKLCNHAEQLIAIKKVGLISVWSKPSVSKFSIIRMYCTVIAFRDSVLIKLATETRLS